MIAIYVLTTLLMLTGLAGTLLPVVPGAALILLGAVVYAAATGFDPVGPGRLLILAALAGSAYVLDYAAGALGARRFGGSGWAVGGALVGALVGIFFGLPGLVFGPPLGAVAAEWLHTRQTGTSLRTGLGTAIGLLVGVGVKLGIAALMIVLFLVWVLRG